MVAIFCLKLLSNEKPVINGDGKQTRDYVFVGDVIRANLKALSYSGSNIFNIGTGKETTVNQIFAYINSTAGVNFEEIHGPAKDGEQIRSVIDYRKAQKFLGWQPQTELADGIKRTVEFFKSKLNKS